MPLNRFSTVGQGEYTAQHVPLPFEAIGALGAKMTQDHANKQNEVDVLSDALNKIKVTDQVLVNTPGQGSGVGYASTGYSDFKNKTISKFSTASKQLADEYASGKLTGQEFSQKVSNMKSELSNDYQKLKIAEANSSSIDAQDKLYRAHKDVGQKTHLANQLASHGDEFIKNPYSTEYKGAPIADAVDEMGTMNKFASDFKDKILKNTTSYTDAAGKIHYKSMTGVGANDIRTAVNAGFDNDAIGHDYKERVDRQLLNHNKKWNDEIDVPNYDNNGKEIGTKKAKLGDVIYGQMREDFTQGVIAKARHENPDEKILNDKRWDFEREKEIVDQLHAFRSNSIQGERENLIDKDPQAQKAIADKVISINTNKGSDYGKVNVNWDNLSTTIKYKIKDSVSGKIFDNLSKEQVEVFEKNNEAKHGWKSNLPSMGEYRATPYEINQPSQEKINQLNDFTEKAAKAIGYSSTKLKDLRNGNLVNNKGEKISWHSQVDGILSAYNVLTSTRLGATQLDANLSSIEATRIQTSPESYDIYNPETDSTQPGGLVLNKGDVIKPGIRTFIDGKPYLKSTIQSVDKDNNPITKTVFLSSKNQDQKSYFGAVGESREAIKSTIISGNKVLPENLKLKNEIGLSENGKELDAQGNEKKSESSTYASGLLHNTKTGSLIYEFHKNDSSPSLQAYDIRYIPKATEKNKNPKEKIYRFNDYALYESMANDLYYVYGEGRHEINAAKTETILKRLKTYEDKSEE